MSGKGKVKKRRCRIPLTRADETAVLGCLLAYSARGLEKRWKIGMMTLRFASQGGLLMPETVERIRVCLAKEGFRA